MQRYVVVITAEDRVVFVTDGYESEFANKLLLEQNGWTYDWNTKIFQKEFVVNTRTGEKEVRYARIVPVVSRRTFFKE